MLDEHGPQPATHILWFHTNVFTELFHGIWTDHLVRAGIPQEPGQALLTGEGFLGADELRTTDLRSSETATKSSVLKSTRLDGHKVAAAEDEGCNLKLIRYISVKHTG